MNYEDNLKKSRKNYNELIVFLIIVAVSISGFCLYSKNKEEEKSTEVVKEGPIIHFDDNLSDDSEQNETNDQNDVTESVTIAKSIAAGVALCPNCPYNYVCNHK